MDLVYCVSVPIQPSRMDQLQEALAQVATLTAELTKSTQIATETDERNTGLCKELTKAGVVNESLSQQLEHLQEEMSREREKSVSVLEEELRRQHELQSQLEQAQRELSGQEGRAESLAEELRKEQQLHEELRAEVQSLEQALHDRDSVALEKQLLESTMSEKERALEALEREAKALRKTSHGASLKNANFEVQVKALVSATEDLNSKLSEAARANTALDRDKTRLQQKLESLERVNASLREVAEESSESLERLRGEMKSLKLQNKTEVCRNT